MLKKPETFNQFLPEPGSKDAETAWVEGEERFQEFLGGDPERGHDEDPGDQNKTEEESEERQEMYRTTYLNRKRAENDLRNEADIRAELQTLLDRWRDTDLWKATSPSFATVLEEELRVGEFSKKGRPDHDVHNAKIKWLNGKDLE